MLLAIDTATRQISLALYDGRRVLAEHTWRTAQQHTVELAPQTALLLRQAGIEPGSLSGIAVALGPGSYTGLRIGLGFAKGLALAQCLPLFGVPTLDILLHALPGSTERVLALLEAGRGRLIVGAYFWNGRRWMPEGPPRVLDAAALLAEVHPSTLICGEWDAIRPDELRALQGRATFASPSRSLRRAGHLAEIGWERLQRNDADDPATLAPLYAGQLEGRL
ncbi:MAG: tRNA (adenosine(37)-N6)-threonylcarbamoyltransferase complex dimerization subunit type 1 TsaB [Anaerolineales bacterium]|nr:tRNA (adenosine(37)-N6)-threonylcarbamoyltransferase complex dimerization subunit type 1 TsaB [Anaerolineales bacterium]